MVQGKQTGAGFMRACSLLQVSYANAHGDLGDRKGRRSVKGNQQTAINRGKIHRYPSLGPGTGFITLPGAGRTPSSYSNVCESVSVCAQTSVSTTRWKREILTYELQNPCQSSF